MILHQEAGCYWEHEERGLGITVPEESGCTRGSADEALPCCREASGGPYRATVLAAAVMLSIADESVHGYELVEKATSLVGHMVAVDKGSVYRLLRDFESKGLLTSNWEEQPSGPSRRVYHLTARGARCLASITRGLVDRAHCLLELAREAEGRLVYAPTEDTASPETTGAELGSD